MFAILKKIANEGETITGIGVIEIMQDGFGFLRSLNQITYLVPTIYMLAQVKLKDLVEELVIVLKEKLGLQNKESAILR